MRFIVASVGKPRERNLAAAIAEYEARAKHYWPLEFHEVREEPGRGLSRDVVRERESARLEARIGGSRVIACDERGTGMTSVEFAAWMQESRERAQDVAFVIGGAHGLAPAMRDHAAVRLALAPWTLPHELARLVLAEQLYRAGTIARGEPYHKS